MPQLPRGWYHLLLYRWQTGEVQAVCSLNPRYTGIIAVTDILNAINRQLASLSAKVQAYEDVISKLSNRFGVSDEQLVNIALAAV